MPFPSLRDLSTQGLKLSFALASGFFTTAPPGKPHSLPYMGVKDDVYFLLIHKVSLYEEIWFPSSPVLPEYTATCAQSSFSSKPCVCLLTRAVRSAKLLSFLSFVTEPVPVVALSAVDEKLPARPDQVRLLSLVSK